MSGPDSLFRPEAVDFHQQGDGPGGVVALRRPWVLRLHRVALALVVAGLAAGLVIRVDERVSGAAVVDPAGRRFVALLPAGSTGDVAVADPVRLESTRPARTHLTGRVATIEAVTVTGARRAGFPAAREGGVVVQGTVGGPIGGPEGWRAVVVVGSGRLLEVLFR